MMLRAAARVLGLSPRALPAPSFPHPRTDVQTRQGESMAGAGWR